MEGHPYKKIEYLLDYLEWRIKEEEKRKPGKALQTFSLFQKVLQETEQEHLLADNILNSTNPNNQ